jgi:hypothetical protein
VSPLSYGPLLLDRLRPVTAKAANGLWRVMTRSETENRAIPGCRAMRYSYFR